jgi:hypothetical protein
VKHTGRVFLSHVLLGEAPEFPSTKTLEEHLEKIAAVDVVYEDQHTVAYVQHDDDSGSTTKWDLRVAIALKDHVPTLLDLDVGDSHTATVALLRAIQAVAFKLKLYDKGFEIRCDVLPPSQRKGYLEIKLRSGKHGGELLAAAPGTSA